MQVPFAGHYLAVLVRVICSFGLIAPSDLLVFSGEPSAANICTSLRFENYILSFISLRCLEIYRER